MKRVVKERRSVLVEFHIRDSGRTENMFEFVLFVVLFMNFVQNGIGTLDSPDATYTGNFVDGKRG